MGKKIDLTGYRSGRLVALYENGHDKQGKLLWLCRCDCGNEVTVRGKFLRSGHTQSCGCLMRELASERSTKHGLYKSNPRLYHSVFRHFRDIREGGVYQNWTLDPRYPNNAEGAAMFCMDVITLYPEECARYEVDESLELDKDNNAERVFRPEDCRFVSTKENCNNKRNTVRLEDGTPLAMFCSEIGIQTYENGRPTRQYIRIGDMYRNGKIHPELLAKANEYLISLKRLKASLDLLAEVREFAHGYKV